MESESHRWYSDRIGRDVHVRVYGHFGQPILVFPTSGGDEREYEGQGMFDTLGHHVQAGRVKFFCVSSVNNDSWYNKSIHPADRAKFQVAYDSAIANEVLPFIEHHCHSKGVAITTTGASCVGATFQRGSTRSPATGASKISASSSAETAIE